MVWFMPSPSADTGRVMGEIWYDRILAMSEVLIAEGSAKSGARASLLGAKTCNYEINPIIRTCIVIEHQFVSIWRDMASHSTVACLQ